MEDEGRMKNFAEKKRLKTVSLNAVCGPGLYTNQEINTQSYKDSYCKNCIYLNTECRLRYNII